MAVSSAVDSISHFAVCSRIFLLCLSFFSNLIIPDHEASDVFVYKSIDSVDIHFLDRIVNLLFGGLIRWDSHYFLHIAQYGYTEESKLAFFPLFPLLIRSIASFVHFFLSNFISFNSLLLVSSVLVNFLLFIKCSLLLYELTRKIFKDDVLAYYSAIIFCVNPASIFFSAPYSESLYAYLTFFTMLNCLGKNFVTASFASGLSCAARSNGTLNIGFIVYTFLTFSIRNFSLCPSYFLTFIIVLAVLVVLALAPFALFQLYSYVKFCPNIESADFTPPVVSWCNDNIPLAYSYVQKRYWNVGFLRYYELKQVPNFLLAAPIICLLLTLSYKVVLKDQGLLRKVVNLKIISEIHRSSLIKDKVDHFVFVIHAALLTLFCVLFIHIQVSTRMLCSSSPVFYWFAAECFRKNFDTIRNKKSSQKISFDLVKISRLDKVVDHSNTNEEVVDTFYSLFISHYWKMFYNKDKNSLVQVFLIMYCLGYFVIGTVLFSNFYPWT